MCLMQIYDCSLMNNADSGCLIQFKSQIELTGPINQVIVSTSHRTAAAYGIVYMIVPSIRWVVICTCRPCGRIQEI
jgi:hypothetical protein